MILEIIIVIIILAVYIYTAFDSWGIVPFVIITLIILGKSFTELKQDPDLLILLTLLSLSGIIAFIIRVQRTLNKIMKNIKQKR